MTDELAKSNLAVNLAEIKRHKRGDIRVDGRIFWEYNKACRNGERWVAVATFKHYSKLAKEAGQKRYQNNREKATQISKAWRANNLVRYKDSNQKYYAANLERILEKQRSWVEKNRKKVRSYQAEWRAKNVQKIREYHAEYGKHRRSNDLIFCLIARLRVGLYKALKAKDFRKKGRTKDFIGCSAPSLKLWIEKQFSNGMSWEDRKAWHVDHLVPIYLGKTPEEVCLLNHYTNLRPLWKSENLSKNKTLPDSIPEYVHPDIQRMYQQAKQNPTQHQKLWSQVRHKINSINQQQQ